MSRTSLIPSLKYLKYFFIKLFLIAFSPSLLVAPFQPCSPFTIWNRNATKLLFHLLIKNAQLEAPPTRPVKRIPTAAMALAKTARVCATKLTSLWTRSAITNLRTNWSLGCYPFSWEDWESIGSTWPGGTRATIAEVPVSCSLAVESVSGGWWIGLEYCVISFQTATTTHCMTISN
jgi:hypothetical protein